jgi:NAD+ synthase (glutamine-hydrolysing)
MKIGMLQQNYIVGDCNGNAKKIIDGYTRLCDAGVELVVGSELAILGYPPKDLLEFSAKIYEQQLAFEELCRSVGKIPLIIGIAEKNLSIGKPLFNNVVVIQNMGVIARRSKELLPTYDVFDEQRYFQPGPRRPCIVPYKGKRLGIVVCEDAWGGTENPTGQRLYATDPVEDMLLANPDILIIVNASPYFWGKGSVRFDLISGIARRLGCPVIYVNQVGGQDELIFDGRSFAVHPDGSSFGCVESFEEDLFIVDTESSNNWDYPFDHDDLGELYRALVLGARDYIHKTGFKKVVIAESGGIDSALTTCIAVDAVGAENVIALGMPSEFSSDGSVSDSEKLCQNLKVKFEVVPIGGIYKAFGSAVSPIIGWRDPENFGKDVTEENVQARTRGMIVMAYSNRTGAMVFTTGNKSELAVGYCTLYGDMVGGFAVISDIPKCLVFKLAKHINDTRGEIIPWSIINKPPSAELRPNQKDQDSLPLYEILDEILRLHVEEELDAPAIIATGLPEADVRWVIRKVFLSEYKRRQGALGLKVTTKAFGSGRRIPIAMKN